VVDSCCCVVQDGRMICTLTGGRSRPAAVPPASEQAAGLPGRPFSRVRAGALLPSRTAEAGPVASLATRDAKSPWGRRLGLSPLDSGLGNL
jgi:hypothetical protein